MADPLAFLDQINVLSGEVEEPDSTGALPTDGMDLSFLDEIAIPEGLVTEAPEDAAAPTPDPFELDPALEGFAPTAQNLDDVINIMHEEGISVDNALTVIGALTASELSDIEGVLKQQIPDAKFRTDDAGERIVRLPSGKEFALNKKGMSTQDVIPFISNILIEWPVAAASKFLYGVFGVSAVDYVRQDINKSLGGGDISIAQVATAGALEGGLRKIGDFVGGFGRDVIEDASVVNKQANSLGIKLKTSDINPPTTPFGKVSLAGAERAPLFGGGPSRAEQTRNIDAVIKDLDRDSKDFISKLDSPIDQEITELVNQGYREIREVAGSQREHAVQAVEASYARGGPVDVINTGETLPAVLPGRDVVPVPEGAILPDPTVTSLDRGSLGAGTADQVIPTPMDTRGVESTLESLMVNAAETGTRTAPVGALNYISKFTQDMQGLDLRKAIALRTRLNNKIAAAKTRSMSQTPGKAKEELAILTPFKREVDKMFREHVGKHGGKEALEQWNKANGIFDVVLNLSNRTGLRKVLNQGNLQPEAVMKLLRTGSDLEIGAIKASLTPDGMKTVRTAIVHDMIQKNKLKGVGDLDRDVLAKDLYSKPIYKIFFDDPKEFDALVGLARVIKVTKAGRAIQEGTGEMTGTGSAGAGQLTKILGTLTGQGAGTIGLRALYDSTPVKKLLIAAGKTQSMGEMRAIMRQLTVWGRATVQANQIATEGDSPVTVDKVKAIAVDLVKGAAKTNLLDDKETAQ